MSRPSAPEAGGPVRLNHAVLFVTELDRAVRFYRQVLGMEVIAAEPRAPSAFLRLPRSRNHHDLGLFAVGGEPRGRARSPGLYHLAWQVDTIDDLLTMRGELERAGALTGQSSHGATKSVYGIDPDGNELEIMWLLPREAWGDHATAAVVEPLDLDAELDRWSGTRTAWPAD